MKAILVTGAVLLSALTAVAQTAPPPQAAQPAQTTTPPENAPPDPAVKPQQPNAAQAPVVEADNPKDSALVRAAKRSGRFKKKGSVVITNDNLIKDGGHFTTTKSQEALPDASGGTAPAATTDANSTPSASGAVSATDKAYEERTKAAKEAKVKRAAADLAAERAMDPAGQAAQQIPKSKVAPTLPGAPSTAPTPQMAQPPSTAATPPPPQPPY